MPQPFVRTYDVHPRFGRHQVLDARTLAYRRSYSGEPIKPADHEPNLPVLDQEDLIDQGIRTSELFPGLDDLPALGSCGGNSGTEVAAALLTPVEATAVGLDVTDAVAAEKYAIGVYSDATKRDEWHDVQFPSDDCGTSGLAIAKVLRSRGICDQYGTATTAEEFARDMGHGTCLFGMPWYQAWFEPTSSALLDDVTGWENSPIDGGHLVTATALEKVTFTKTGDLDPKRTIVRLRNHWTTSWGDGGSFRLSLDLYQQISDQVDIIQPRREHAA
ncbi:hypothetical protein OG552_10535 [Streptomyces sp. NBC_01476]|uniref:hypothetical protein n=1 Tax=Streptomyces sp. NBC_01476 TaxID=2903881 RepID=UPI002E363A2A|nr:hypothetical protein [Streptomyces sp. NBC_01476]